MDKMELITNLLKKLDEIKDMDTDSMDELMSESEMIIKKLFGEKHSYSNDIFNIRMIYHGDISDFDQWRSAKKELTILFKTILKECELFEKNKELVGDTQKQNFNVIEGEAMSSERKQRNGSVAPYVTHLVREEANRKQIVEQQKKLVKLLEKEVENKSITVFVIHGRNKKIKDGLFDFLRAIGLKPIEWMKAMEMTGKTSPYIGEILECAFKNAQAVIMLMTPDDEAILREEFHSEHDLDYEKILTPQARPNVLFEGGMAMGKNPDRTIIVEVGQIRPFSDISGRHIIKLDNSPQKRQELAQRLITAKCKVDTSGTDWYEKGDFELKKKKEHPGFDLGGKA